MNDANEADEMQALRIFIEPVYFTFGNEEKEKIPE